MDFWPDKPEADTEQKQGAQQPRKRWFQHDLISISFRELLDVSSMETRIVIRWVCRVNPLVLGGGSDELFPNVF